MPVDPQTPDTTWYVELAKVLAAMVAGIGGGAYWKRSRSSREKERPVGWQEFLNDIRRELRAIRVQQDLQSAEHEIHGNRLNDLDVAVAEHTRVLHQISTALRAATRPPGSTP